MTYMRLAGTPLQDVLSQLVRTPGTIVAPEVRLYFRDVLDHSMRSNETIDALRDMLATALNVNQALVTLSQGEVDKRLAGWAAVLAVPTLGASWYGMNFSNMPHLVCRYHYPILICALVIVCFGFSRSLPLLLRHQYGATPP